MVEWILFSEKHGIPNILYRDIVRPAGQQMTGLWSIRRENREPIVGPRTMTPGG